MKTLSAFKAYDVRGRVPDELDADFAYSIGRAFVRLYKLKRAIIGRDIRPSGVSLSSSLARGMADEGASVFDIGLCGTEEVYFATFHEKMDGGVMVTASHNPADYNGMKFVREEGRPVSADTGLMEIGRMAQAGGFGPPRTGGNITLLDTRKDYIAHLLGYVDIPKLKKLRIVANSGNGCAGPVVDELAEKLPFEFVRINHEPDGTFPSGVPNPILPENREATRSAVQKSGADFGVAWDGDFDRCFFFDEEGGFIEGYYLVGLLAAAMLKKYPGGKIIHDPRLLWNTEEIVRSAGGETVKCKSGHAFIKEKMRQVDGVYGGEMSAHHYFRSFSYCDSGMIPWLLVAGLMSDTGQKLSKMVKAMQTRFPVSGEINRRVVDQAAAIRRVREKYEPSALNVDETDGISLEFPKWRFNLRSSNTEPVIRLNVESRGDEGLLREKTAELLELIG
ncbi:phosphomannomutase [bacterium]|nr:MAG: phosphomannomutase [bacterium]